MRLATTCCNGRARRSASTAKHRRSDVPQVPSPTSWRLEAPPEDHPHDLWAVGADLEPGTLLAAYRLGLFPMPVGPRPGWFSPVRRAIVPLESFSPSRSLRRATRRFEIRVDNSFAEVVAECARPGDPASWIDATVAAAYTGLHELGWAHSLESWDADGLAGGLYGVEIGGLFAAESMFRRRADASKAAFVALVEHLRAAGHVERRLLDVQWLTPHLASLGAREVSRAAYRARLAAALDLPPALACEPLRKGGRCRS
jgi:leucyl/phenylalanyl-tRNA--protein transferase